MSNPYEEVPQQPKNVSEKRLSRSVLGQWSLLSNYLGFYDMFGPQRALDFLRDQKNSKNFIVRYQEYIDANPHEQQAETKDELLEQQIIKYDTLVDQLYGVLNNPDISPEDAYPQIKSIYKQVTKLIEEGSV